MSLVRPGMRQSILGWRTSLHESPEWRAQAYRNTPGFAARAPGGHKRQSLCWSSTSSTASTSGQTEAPQGGEMLNGEPQEPSKAARRRVVSGVQPTGTLHLGNYLGAIQNWVGLQELYETFFIVVDMHATTMPHDPNELRESTRKTAALYIALGIDPDTAPIFVQSHVSAHAELFWLLNCITPIGWLERMIQYKEKAKKQGEDVRGALLSYPVLQAADILLYQADLVPVGEDQRQHLELTRDIAERFNYLFGGRKWKKRGGRGGAVFKVPEAFIQPTGARIMSLLDAKSKMSKSAPSDASRINLLDDAAAIRQKIKRATTDSAVGLEFGNPDRPECHNLLTIYQLMTGMSQESVERDVGSMRWGDFKPVLADAIVAHLAPIQGKYRDVICDLSSLDDVLARGAATARETANRSLQNCYDAMGFLNRT